VRADATARTTTAETTRYNRKSAATKPRSTTRQHRWSQLVGIDQLAMWLTCDVAHSKSVLVVLGSGRRAGPARLRCEEKGRTEKILRISDAGERAMKVILSAVYVCDRLLRHGCQGHAQRTRRRAGKRNREAKGKAAQCSEHKTAPSSGRCTQCWESRH
jgi:hypothetical protein